jgi:putative peptidoglycan lipid II flippase
VAATLAPVPSEGGDLGAAAGTVGAATLVSRVLGLVREQITALLFGAGNAADAFNIAYRVPNLLRDLFAEGALSAAFVPTFTDVHEKEGRAAAWRLGSAVVGWLGLVLAGLLVVGWFVAPWLVRVMAPGFALVPGKLELTLLLTRIQLPFLLFVSLAAAAAGMLNSLSRFGVAALAPVGFNLGAIGVTLAALPFLARAGAPAILALAIGVLAGGLLQVAIQVPSLWRLGFRPAWPPPLAHPGVARIGLLMGPVAIGLSATQINVVVNSLFASLVGPGAVSWLAYAFRVLFVPIGLFGVALATVSLPALSRQASSGDLASLKATLLGALRLGAALSLPAAVGLFVLSEPLTAALFERGHFTAQDTTRTAQALMAYCVGLAAYAGVKVLVPAFYALGDTRTPLIASFCALGANFTLNLLLYRPLGHVGLALAVGVTSLFNFVQLWFWLSRKVGGLPFAAFRATVLRVGLAALAMGGAMAALVLATRPLWRGHLLGEVAACLGAAGAGGALLWWLYGVLRVAEREELERALAGAWRRIAPGRARHGA